MISSQNLYNQDYYLWVQQQAMAITNDDLSAMDLKNLLTEIEDMGASQKRALRSYYYKLVEHILKLRDWKEEKERNQIKWQIEVTNFRNSILDILDDSPSLRNYLEENHAAWFSKVIKNYQNNQLFIISDPNPISLASMLDEIFFG